MHTLSDIHVKVQTSFILALIHCKAKEKNRLRQIFGKYIDFDLKRKPLKPKKVSEVPPMPAIIRTLGAYYCASLLYFCFNFIGSQLKYVPNGLGVRYQRTNSTIPTDEKYVPNRTEVNPL